MKEFRGKKVIITGGNRGIGLATTRALIDFGAEVTSLSTSGTSEFAHPSFFTLKCDVTNEKDLDLAREFITKKYGDIDNLVINAGITQDRSFKKMSVQDWDSVINGNLNGSFLTLRTFLPLMALENASIVFVTSIIGERGGFGQANYAASKAGIIGLVKSLVHETARRGIRVNAVSPGFVDTDMTAKIPEEIRKTITNEIPMGRFAQPSEIAKTILFLLSRDASFITGEVIRVNGGHLI